MQGLTESPSLPPTTLHVLLEQESRYYSSSRQCCRRAFRATAAPDEEVDDNDDAWFPTVTARNKIAEWGVRVMDFYDFPREAVAAAMNFIDRMVDVRPSTSSQDYQLLAVACVFLAIKLSVDPRCLSVGCLARHVEGRFTDQQILDMEFRVLSTLRWFVHPPTAADFLYQYWSFLVVHSKQYDADDHYNILDAATFAMEQTFVDSFYCDHKPSVIAMAALSMAIQLELPPFLSLDEFNCCRARMMELATKNSNDKDHRKEGNRTPSPVSIVQNI